MNCRRVKACPQRNDKNVKTGNKTPYGSLMNLLYSKRRKKI